MDPTVVTLTGIGSVTVGFIVYLLGAQLTRKLAFLQTFNIPEPVSGGIVVSLITMLLFSLFGIAVEFDLAARDYLLVLFFSTIGMNARLSELARGGKPLVILLVLTVALIFLQNVIGKAGALLFGFPGDFGPIFGSAALIGGHGTVLAWAPLIGEATGETGVGELGVAVATLGLVLAALIGGPVARYLIESNNIPTGTDQDDDGSVVGHSHEGLAEVTLDHVTIMRVMLFLHIAIILGISVQEGLAQAGLQLPLFVPCMLMAIIVGNLHAALAGDRAPVQRTATLSTISEFSLGVFLAMSLMSMQLWTLAGSGLALVAILGCQLLLTLFFMIFVVFRVMGRDYFAAVIAAGFGGFAMGATPTAVANMTAVTKSNGPAPLAFIVLPLVGAFFVDLVNVAVIRLFLSF